MTQDDPSEHHRIGHRINRRRVLKGIGVAGAGITFGSGFTGTAAAATGDQLGEVRLPGQQAGNDGPEGFTCSVGGTFDGTYYTTTDDTSLCGSSTIQLYDPPADGDGDATLVSEKTVVNQDDNMVGDITEVFWDPSRDQYWAADASAPGGGTDLYLVDRGDPTTNQDASATFQFKATEGEADGGIIDGLARDDDDDTLWISEDATSGLEHYETDGTHIETLIPETDSFGNKHGSISGVAIGTELNGRKTLYLGRAGVGEIIRVYADDGEFISKFAQNVSERVEALACDPVTYDSSAILAKDAYNGIYTALEVGEGTCPLSGGGGIPEEPENEPPTAVCDMSFSGDTPVVGEPITFDGSGSSDPDGDTLTYEWDFDGDESTDATGETVEHTYSTAGDKTVTLTVTDPDGASDTCTLQFTVCDPSVTTDLIAGQHHNIGSVEVAHEGENLSVTYSLEDDWYLRETHLHLAGDDDEDGDGDCDRIPQTRNGNPKVGRFALSRDYGPGVQEDTYVIDRDAADNVFGEEFSEGESICIAAHAAVFEDLDGDEAFDEDDDREETAWADGEEFTDRGNWAMHFHYQNPCVENPFADDAGAQDENEDEDENGHADDHGNQDDNGKGEENGNGENNGNKGGKGRN